MATRWAIAPRRERPRLETRAWLRTVGQPGPERWIWPLTALSWVALVWGAWGWHVLGGTSVADHPHAGHAAAAGAPATFAGHLLLWIAMVGATMLPLIAWNLRIVGFRSPRTRRARATLEVAAGWAVAWLAAGVVVSALLVVTAPAPAALTVGVASSGAVAWRFTRTQRVALARCHRGFAPPLGASAGPACARFGASLGRDSLLTCGPSMVLMAVAGHHLLVVVALGWVAWRDMRRPGDSPGDAVAVAVLVAAGLFAVAQP